MHGGLLVSVGRDEAPPGPCLVRLWFRHWGTGKIWPRAYWCPGRRSAECGGLVYPEPRRAAALTAECNSIGIYGTTPSQPTRWERVQTFALRCILFY